MAAVEPPSQVRPLTEEELPAVERAVRKMPDLHRERLESQRREEAVYFFAWVGEAPVGHVLLRWPSTLGVDAAELEDLGVDEPWRRRGVGTQLVARCEDEAVARGFVRIALNVGIDNGIARAFYGQRGYREMSADAPHRITWPHREETGAVVAAEEWCTTFTKELRY